MGTTGGIVEGFGKETKRMRAKIGAVSLFIEEDPSHSQYNIKTVAESLEGFPDLRMIVISNGCSVGESLRDYLYCRQDLIFLELSMNIGVPAAWNIGIDLLIDCDYIFFLNDDLWVDHYCIEEIIKVFKEKPDSAVVGVEGVLCKELDEKGFPTTHRRYQKKKRRILSIKKTIDVTNVSGFLFAVNMDFILKTRFRFDTRFSPVFCEEFDIAFFARMHGYKARIVGGLDKHYDHSFGVSSETKKVKYLGNIIWSNDIAQRNQKLFYSKWKKQIVELIKP